MAAATATTATTTAAPPLVSVPLDSGRVRRALNPNTKMYLAARASDNSSFTLKGDTDTLYTVAFDETTPAACTCSCPDFVRRHVVCKHLIWLAFRVFNKSWQSGMTWSDLLASASAAGVVGAAAAAAATPARARANARSLAEVEKVLDRISNESFAQSWKVRRPRLDASDLCCICLMSLVPLAANDKIHWCRYGCGLPVHANCACHLMEPKCPQCRDDRFYTNRARYGRRL